MCAQCSESLNDGAVKESSVWFTLWLIGWLVQLGGVAMIVTGPKEHRWVYILIVLAGIITCFTGRILKP